MGLLIVCTLSLGYIPVTELSKFEDCTVEAYIVNGATTAQ